jgi:hypothetical protein
MAITGNADIDADKAGRFAIPAQITPDGGKGERQLHEPTKRP